MKPLDGIFYITKIKVLSYLLMPLHEGDGDYFQIVTFGISPKFQINANLLFALMNRPNEHAI